MDKILAASDKGLDMVQRIATASEHLDGLPFLADHWEKPADAPLGGGGLTRIIEEGNLLERGGVGFSHVIGRKLPPSASAHRPELAGRGFEAMGVSLVFHPRNPYVPTVHMNVRMFLARADEQDDVFWFGGGMDLTPYYATEENARHFHATCRKALAPYGEDKHPRFKKWCDEYFFLTHRNEPRGVGGVFFDDFSELGFDQSFLHEEAAPGARLVLPGPEPPAHNAGLLLPVDDSASRSVSPPRCPCPAAPLRRREGISGGSGGEGLRLGRNPSRLDPRGAEPCPTVRGRTGR